jgi:uncharacterized protein YecT (DUF1311 family)
MSRIVLHTALLALVFLSACSKGRVDCGSDSAFEAVIPLVQEKIDQKTRDRVHAANNNQPIATSRVRAAVRQATFTIIDVRTTQQDPNSTRRFCVGRLKVAIPPAVVQEADRGRQAAGIGTILQLAEGSDIDRDGGAFVVELRYNIQPTDDGNRVYAELEEADGAANFFAETFAFYLLRPIVEQARIEQDRQAADQRRLEQQQEQEQEAALTEQRAAILDQARSENRLSEQTINAVWRGIPPDTRSQLLEMQRAWLRRRVADCRIESAAASTQPQEREAARLRCDTRVTNERINYLRQFASGY